MGLVVECFNGGVFLEGLLKSVVRFLSGFGFLILIFSFSLIGGRK